MHPIITHQMAALQATDYRRQAELHHLHARQRRSIKQHAGTSTVRSPVRRLRAALATLRLA